MSADEETGTQPVAVAAAPTQTPKATSGPTLLPPPFWRPLSSEERAAEWRVTELFCSLLYKRDVKRAVLRLKEQGVPNDVGQALIGDPIILRLVVYAFNPRRDDPKVWPKLRQFVRWETEIRYVLGIGPELAKQGINLHWINSLLGSVQYVWSAQDARAAGDSRDFKTIVAEYRDACRPVTETTPEGQRTLQRMPLPGGWEITGVYWVCLDGTKHEEIIWELPSAVDPIQWREVIDQMVVRYLQQFGPLFGVKESYFSDQAGITRVMKLVADGELIAERPLHLAKNYGPLIETFAQRYVFGASQRELEDDAGEADPVPPEEREVSRQVALAALFEVAITYRQEWGWVPGVLEARMRGVMTREFRDKGVSREVGGVRELTDKTEHSGDASLEPAPDIQNEAQSPGGIEAMIDTEGEPVGARNRGAAAWQDTALERVSIHEFLDPLTEPQRRLALLLMEGLLPADAAKLLGVARSAVSQMMTRMRPILAEVLARRPQ